MPSFSFSPKVVVPRGRKSEYKHISKYTIETKSVYGVVCIKLNKIHYIQTTELGEVPIHPDSFNTEGVRIVYPKKLLNGRVYCLIRDPFYGLAKVSNSLPFAPGCYVLGDIVFNNIIKQRFFKIKKIWDSTGTEACKQARKFYIDNYEVIYGSQSSQQ